jgi:hypothetical protein
LRSAVELRQATNDALVKEFSADEIKQRTFLEHKSLMKLNIGKRQM